MRQEFEVMSWSELIATYRGGDRSDSGAEVLRRLEGTIAWIACRHLGTSGVDEGEDINQQLILGVLEHAFHLRLPEDERWIPRMLVERALRDTRTWLQRSTRLHTVPLDESVIAPHSIEAGADSGSLDRLRGRGVSDGHLHLLFKHHVLGLTLGDLANAGGTTPSAVAAVLSRTRSRLRAEGIRNSDSPYSTANARATHGRTVTFRGGPRQLRDPHDRVCRRGHVVRPDQSNQEEEVAMRSVKSC